MKKNDNLSNAQNQPDTSAARVTVQHSVIPNLFILLAMIASNNNMVLKEDFVEIEGVDYNLLESQASRLDNEEKAVFATGEEFASNYFKINLHLHELDKFLDDVFDGYLTKYFYEV